MAASTTNELDLQESKLKKWSKRFAAVILMIIISSQTILSSTFLLFNGKTRFDANLQESPIVWIDDHTTSRPPRDNLGISLYKILSLAEKKNLGKPIFKTMFDEFDEFMDFTLMSQLMRLYTTISDYEKARIMIVSTIAPMNDCIEILYSKIPSDISKESSEKYAEKLYGLKNFNRRNKKSDDDVDEIDFVKFRANAIEEFSACGRLHSGFQKYIEASFSADKKSLFFEEVRKSLLDQEKWKNKLDIIKLQLTEAINAGKNLNKEQYYENIIQLTKNNKNIETEIVNLFSIICLNDNSIIAENNDNVRSINRPNDCNSNDKIHISRIKGEIDNQITLINTMKTHYQPPETISTSKVILTLVMCFIGSFAVSLQIVRLTADKAISLVFPRGGP